MTKRRVIVKLLTDAGYIPHEGTNHEKFVKGTITVLVPRHREIPEEIAKRILRQASLR